MFKVHIGYTPKGNARWARFDTLAGASTFCEKVFRERSIVLSIITT